VDLSGARNSINLGFDGDRWTAVPTRSISLSFVEIGGAVVCGNREPLRVDTSRSGRF
jgi:hypothetical protein